MGTLQVPVLSNFVVEPRVFGSLPFTLSKPTSTNTSALATYTFTTDTAGSQIISINGETVTILKAGNANITATQTASLGFSSASITRIFTVNIATPTLSNFVIPNKSFADISFIIPNPSSNSAGSFSFFSLTPAVVTVNGNIAYIKRVGRASIRATQFSSGNYGSASVVADFDVLTSIVRVGVQNQIDLSWNRPSENGATIKNYFFYVEERKSAIAPAPSVNTIMETVSPTVSSYYSYALPVPYSTSLSSVALSSGIDINISKTLFNITTSPTLTQKNYFDLGYYGEIELSWIYHNDSPILELTSGSVASTTMTLSLYKENSANAGDNRIDFLRSIERFYDSEVNCLGPRPQNNNKTMTDIFTINFDTGFDSGTGTATSDRLLKYLKPTDVISGNVKFSDLSYSSVTSSVDLSYSIILKNIRITPYRQALTRDFTSLGFGRGIADTGVGFTVSTVNAFGPLYSSGILYHAPKMTRPLADFNEAKWTFSWNYGANMTKLTTDISFLPIEIPSGTTVVDISNLLIPFQLRIRGFSRPYSSVSSSILPEQYNTTIASTFLENTSNILYHTRLLFDVSLNLSASRSEIVNGTIESTTFDISGASGFPLFSSALDTSHTQMVFLFQLSISDLSYNAYFRSISNPNDAFRVKMLSQTFTPRQEYRFGSPDPTIASSNSLTSLTNTTYNISDIYTIIPTFYRYYNLINGVFYSYKIASNSRAGTSPFSEVLTRRCGSVPNQIVNRIVDNQNTLTIESERTSNQVNIYWEKPGFSGYEITHFIIQMIIDANGRWLTILDYTKDLSHSQITFGEFEDIIVPVTNQTDTIYSRVINTYRNKLTGVGGSLINGSKYYFRLAGVNELGYSLYSTILSGIVFARPNSSIITFVDTLVGDNLVYITWKIPPDDAGSPILTYIIDYEETGTNIKKQYKENQDVPSANELKNRFFTVYTKTKNYDSLTAIEKANLDISRNELTKYIIPPTPITINDSDYILNLTNTNPPNKIVKLSFSEKTFTYISDELKQNVFDLANIQLKWYYFNDNSWPDDATTVSFKMSIRGHLIDVSGNTALNISNIFYIPPGNVNIAGGVERYTVNRTMFSTTSNVKNINYKTGLEIVNNDVPTILIPTLPRIDSYNNRRYKLQIDYEITEFFPNTGTYRFFLYSGPIVVNGSAPVRTSPNLNLNTIFTYKIVNVPNVSPVENRKTYNFKFTPFNLNEFFPVVNSIPCTIGTSFSVPISEMSYSLIPTSAGGRVVIQWKYLEISDYNINITIPEDFQNGDQEYESINTVTGTRSIFVKGLNKDSNNNVTYYIPSTETNDILTGNAQKYLRSGRAYTITVGAVKIVLDSIGNRIPLASPIRTINPTGTYIIPVSTPLRPLELRALGNNGFVALKWKLPNLQLDPNYYTTSALETDPPMPFYRYKFYSIDVRDISANLQAQWISLASEIEIPSSNIPGTETVYTASNLINKNYHQFRVRLMIINSYNNQRTFSDYSYMSNINNIAVTESSGNTIYPSSFPYKPSAPIMNFANRLETIPGLFNGLLVSFDYPEYNGNAQKYECFIEYTPPPEVSGSGTMWIDIFDSDPNKCIANKSDNASILTSILDNSRLLTSEVNGPTRTQRFTIICKETIKKYGIRIRLLGTNIATPYTDIDTNTNTIPNSLYSDYSSVDYIDNF